MSPKDAADHPLVERLKSIVGPAYVLTSPEDRAFFAHDVYRQMASPIAVVQPGTVTEMAAAIGAATAAGIAVVARGGGASYSDGYCAASEATILLDTQRLTKITVNAGDMYVTVEAGVTWASLREALRAHGLRTPFWGPYSGLKATVGGSVSQGAVSLGSSLFGASADSVLGLEVILADGTLLKTGAAAIDNGAPFFRHYGPDLVGLFTGDTGAMGVKARITLRLIKDPPVSMAASFGFATFAAMAEAMAAVARENVASDTVGLNPRLQKAWLGRVNLSQSLAAARAVFANSRGPVSGLWKLVRMAVAGNTFLDRAEYSAHFTVEGVDTAHARSLLAVVRRAVGRGGVEVPNTIPTVVRATPFMPLYPILGPAGERWVPLHGVLPFSRCTAFHDRLHALLTAEAARMEALKVHTAAMFTTIGTTGFLYEPVFYWQDARHLYHQRYLPQEFLNQLPEYPPNPEARAYVEEMRNRIRALFAECGATHFQVGKSYPYLQGRDPRNEALLRELKRVVDPQGLMNPGSLGLGGP